MDDLPAAAPFPNSRQPVPGTTDKMNPRPDPGRTAIKLGSPEGQEVLITGGDSGIGRAVALAFAREGAALLVSYLEQRRRRRNSAAWFVAAGRTCVLMPGDIGKAAHCRALVDRAVQAIPAASTGWSTMPRIR